MATIFNLSNEIIRVFDHFRRNDMTSDELLKKIIDRNIKINMDQLMQAVRAPALFYLFYVQNLPNNSHLIKLTPQLTLCEDCLQKGCRNRMKCTKLHICRYVSHIHNKPLDKPCNYPHKLTQHPNNIVLLEQSHYDELDEDVLLRLLRYHYNNTYRKLRVEHNAEPHRLTQSPSGHFHAKDFSQVKEPMHSINVPQSLLELNVSPTSSSAHTDDVTERQIDVCIPSQREAPHIDLEIVELLLTAKDIMIEQILEKQISNEFCRRFTIQLATKQIVNKILQTEPIMTHENALIKMKRTARRRDRKTFTLKFQTKEKIDNMRLKLYVETLAGKACTNILDMTSEGSSEQIHLIQCEEPIDFERLYKIHKGKNTLQGYQVTVIEVYEVETLQLSFVPNTIRQPMTSSRLRQLIGERRWQQDLFACLGIQNQVSAEIELMNPEVTKKWLSESTRIRNDMNLVIQPIIDFVESPENNEDEQDDEDSDDDEEDEEEEVKKIFSKAKLSAACSPVGEAEHNKHIFRIKHKWGLVLFHPTFGDEYKKYIDENLNMSIEINHSCIQVPTEHVLKQLVRYSKMFIQKFIFQEVSNLSYAQVKILKSNYSRMAHKWIKKTNKTIIAARRDVMNEIFPLLCSNSPEQIQINRTPLFPHQRTPTPRQQESPSVSPVVRQNIHKPPVLQTKQFDDQLQISSYPIENKAYFPFFSSTSSFPNRLKTYMWDTYRVKLEIEQVPSTKIVLELKGQLKDVHEARHTLSALFSSLKTNTYSDTKNSSKFAIPNLSSVAQCKLDQSSIVSACSSTKNNGSLIVRYFADHPQFGVDSENIDDIINNDLFYMSHSVETTSKKMGIEFDKLVKKVKQSSDYEKEICCLYKDEEGSTQQIRLYSIHLCGTKSIVQQIYKDVTIISDTYSPIPCNVELDSDQTSFLLQVCTTDLIDFEKQYSADGVDLQSKLQNPEKSQFIAPKYLHEKVKLFLLEMSQIRVISKEIPSSTQLIQKKKTDLYDLSLKNRCLLSITLISQPTASKVSSGPIKISGGDLATQQSDVLVICSSSAVLRNSILRAAGPQVSEELKGKDLKTPFITSAGQLKQAKRLLFLPWAPDDDIEKLRRSISSFVKDANMFAIQNNYKSIAFPAIGCGAFGVSPDIVAKTMINAARECLADGSLTTQLEITFVIQQPHVHSAFNAILNGTSMTETMSTRSSSSSQEKFKISLTTASSNVATAKNLLDTIETFLTTSFSAQ